MAEIQPSFFNFIIMDMKYKLLAFLLLTLLYSCANKKSKDHNETGEFIGKVELLESHDVSFVLNDETSLKSSFIQAIETKDGNPILVYLNNQKPAIYFYDIKGQALIKELMLSKDGPNAVGTPTGLYFHNMDSIYVIASSYYRVSLVNGKGEVLKKYQLLNDENPNESTGMLRPFTISPPFVIDNKMYFNVAPDRDIYDNGYFLGKVNLVLDLETGDFDYFNHYPKEFNEGVWGVAAVNYSTDYNSLKEEFIYSFSISDSIYVSKVDGTHRSGYLSKTYEKKATQKPMERPENKYDLEYALGATYYDGIIYDRYRDVYYRFVRQPLEIENMEKINFYDFHRKPISVIILDADFKKIGETELEDDVYQSFMYFLTKEGLFVSKGNPNNPNLIEEEANFTCFTLTEVNS
jgi:hypothetical protein